MFITLCEICPDEMNMEQKGANSSYPSDSEGYLIVLQIAVAVSCILSIIGSSLIILTYFCFKDLRTLARHILVCLSIADFIVATANLIGLLFYYQRFVTVTSPSYNSSDDYIPKHWCEVQAAFTVYGTESSILWTIAVSLYMFVLIVLQKRHWGKNLLLFFHIVCWGVPFVLTLWLGVDGFLGFEHSATPGFCAIKGTVEVPGSNGTETYQASYPIIIGYEIWLYVAFLLLPIFCVISSCHVKKTKKPTGNQPSKSKFTFPDKKLIFVALLFMLLRVWSIIVDISVYYLPMEATETYKHSYASAVLGVLEGIGDSGQGAANGVLFCLFTHAVRQKLAKTIQCVYCRKYYVAKKMSEKYSTPATIDEEEYPDIENIGSVMQKYTDSNQKLLLNVGGDHFTGYSATKNS